MLSPAQLFRLLNELVMFLLGAMIVVVAVSGRFFPNRHSATWLGLGAVVIVVGLRQFAATGRYATLARRLQYLRGGSLVLVGALMLAMIGAPFAWVRPMLAAAGAVLLLRGALSAALALKNS
jgi:hypothetical protein